MERRAVLGPEVALDFETDSGAAMGPDQVVPAELADSDPPVALPADPALAAEWVAPVVGVDWDRYPAEQVARRRILQQHRLLLPRPFQ